MNRFIAELTDDTGSENPIWSSWVILTHPTKDGEAAAKDLKSITIDWTDNHPDDPQLRSEEDLAQQLRALLPAGYTVDVASYIYLPGQ